MRSRRQKSNKSKAVSILLISNAEDDVLNIEKHLSKFMHISWSFMHLSWSFMHCINLREAASRIGRSDIIILDLALSSAETPKEIFNQIDEIAFEIPIIVMTGDGEDDHNLATYVIEKGAADKIVRGKFGRLVDAIEFALIRQRISTGTRQKSDTALQDSEVHAAEDRKAAKENKIEDKRITDQMMSWLTGSYSATGK
jgi:DNA-binding NtrC family response regulator